MIALLSAPTNLGLRPPQPGSVPGCAKAPEALRGAGLHARLAASGARDAGVVMPGRYLSEVPAGRSRNEEAIVDHGRRLSAAVSSLWAEDRTPLVLGGDCSVLLGVGHALACRGRSGLVHVDGHTDFRHPGNSSTCENLAGEDLATVVGRHRPAVADVDGLAPYVDARHVTHLGCRDDDEHLAEVRDTLGCVVPASTVLADGPGAAAGVLRGAPHETAPAGFWLHLDVDVLDPTVLPAVDSPDPGGLRPDDLVAVLGELAPLAVGASVCIYDPDLDPTGGYAALLTDLLASGLARLGADRDG
ncbi:arginase family protein [uncultured Nocardioides sp.]|uniref:arginase family protein n=1 Tax=uncultured Nocardioides sp. TaxID=198441 RepID=UPI00261D2EF0|nr:arginase family protein [uncultured Nocardioides sp.]